MILNVDELIIYIITFLGVVSCGSFGKTCKKVFRCCHETYVNNDFDFYLEIGNYLVSLGIDYFIYGGFIRNVIGGVVPNDMDIYIKRKRDSTRAILHLTTLSIFFPTMKKNWYKHEQEHKFRHDSIVFDFGGKQKKIDLCSGPSLRLLQLMEFDFCEHISQNYDFDVNSLYLFISEIIYYPYSQFISRCENLNMDITNLIKKKQCNVNREMLQYGTNIEKKRIVGCRMKKMVEKHEFEIKNMENDQVLQEINEYNEYMENKPYGKNILMFVLCSMNFLIDTFFEDLKKITEDVYMDMRKVIENERNMILNKIICAHSANYLIKFRINFSQEILERCYNYLNQINEKSMSDYLCEIYRETQWIIYRNIFHHMFIKTKYIQKQNKKLVFVIPKKSEKKVILMPLAQEKYNVMKPKKITTIVYFFGFARKERRMNDYDKKIKGTIKEKNRCEIIKEKKRDHNTENDKYCPTKNFRRRELIKNCREI